MLKTPFLFLIRLYQTTLSPDHGLARLFFQRGVCIYRPTCSDYTYQTIEKFGLIKGGWLGLKRLGRCHPWNEPRFDLLKTTKIQETRYKQDTILNI